MGALIEVGELRERLGEPGLVAIDCSFTLGEPDGGGQLWLAGHIPGAPHLDVDRDLSGEAGIRGRHPLPEPDAFETAARAAGISAGSNVVAYDQAGEGGAARLWWLLRHFGQERVVVLNGGLAAWRDAGGPLESGPVAPVPGDFNARERGADRVELEEIEAGLGDTVLLDARAAERYLGVVEPIDPVAGHIPGAVNMPFAELAPHGRFPAPDELRARFEAAGAVPGRELAAYCGSGITA
jgi:thiosulfate/3-mercaptopyruvate sulfurtransferase